MSEMSNEERAETFGAKAVGLSFNPSGDENVQKVKELFAQAFNIVESCCPSKDGTPATDRKRKLRDAALHEIITAQMWAVKVITWK